MVKLRIIAEGDSWFNMRGDSFFVRLSLSFFSYTDVLVEFDRIQRNKPQNPQYLMLGKDLGKDKGERKRKRSFAMMGHTLVDDMLKDAGDIKKKLDAINGSNPKTNKHIKAMLFSAGGNDLRDKFVNLLKKYKVGMQEPEQAIDQKELANLVKRIKNGYQMFIYLCECYELQLIAHSYYYPDLGTGSWLIGRFTNKFTNEFNKKKYPMQLRDGICEYLLDRFVDMLEELQKNKKSFHFIKSHEILRAHKQKNKKKLHKDEIHLNKLGCKLVAQEFDKKLKELLN